MELTITRTKALIGAGILAAAGIGVGLAVSLSGGCNPDPSAQIAAGGVWNGNGQCYTTTGILVTHPVTIENATFEDPTVTQPSGSATQPIIRVKATNNVTIQNVTVQGQGTGGFHASLVGEEGISVLSSDHVTLDHVNTVNTWGDGLYFNGPVPDTNVSVSNVSVNGTGRMGVTPANVQVGTFTDVTITNTANNSWDFESDVATRGSGNVTINGGSAANGVRIIEALDGPVTMNGLNLTGHLSLLFSAAASGQPVAFNGGTLHVPARVVGITIAGPGNLTVNNSALDRLSGKNPQPMWSVTGGGHLTLVNTTVRPPLGTNDASSTVTIR